MEVEPSADSTGRKPRSALGSGGRESAMRARPAAGRLQVRGTGGAGPAEGLGRFPGAERGSLGAGSGARLSAGDLE